MGEQMEFPETFEKFAKEYGFKDDKEVYTNGSDLIPIFRVKQWIEHDNKLRRIETDTAYECGKHATSGYKDGKSDELDKIKAEIKEWYWQADKQALAKDPCVVDAMVDLFIRTIDKYKEDQDPEAFRKFAEWVARELFDNDWPHNMDAFLEDACRKLSKLGLVKDLGEIWGLADCFYTQESEEDKK